MSLRYFSKIFAKDDWCSWEAFSILDTFHIGIVLIVFCFWSALILFDDGITDLFSSSKGC